MKTTFVAALTFLLMTSLPAPVLAKGDTVKITIKGGGLKEPIEIIDPQTLASFRVWTGPGTSSNESQGLIVDWSRGTVTKRPKGLQLYEVSFYAKLPKERLVYVAFYEYDPAAQQGYVYLPGKTDPSYDLNVRTIFHGVEGKWFRSWTAWDAVARPLIARVKAADASALNPGHGHFPL
jgi:hypothetical protein